MIFASLAYAYLPAYLTRQYFITFILIYLSKTADHAFIRTIQPLFFNLGLLYTTQIFGFLRLHIIFQPRLRNKNNAKIQKPEKMMRTVYNGS